MLVAGFFGSQNHFNISPNPSGFKFPKLAPARRARGEHVRVVGDGVRRRDGGRGRELSQMKDERERKFGTAISFSDSIPSDSDSV